jgi:hypothetical protein
VKIVFLWLPAASGGINQYEPGGTLDGMAKGKKKRVTCEECFFHQNMLCALNLDAPCTTFRPAERNLAPERQLSFTFRSERTRSAYAFPGPGRAGSVT